jgi:hypothetical protein
MFLGRVDEARALYLRYRDEQQVRVDRSWKAVVVRAFAEMHAAGLVHPLMDEIGALFSSRG